MLKTAKLIQRTIIKQRLQTLSFAFPKLHKPQNLVYPLFQHSKRYYNEEIQKLIEEHYYKNHTPISLLDNGKPREGPYSDVVRVAAIPHERHVEPKTMLDKAAIGLIKILKVIVHLVFRDRYLHHSVVLETVAAVPGMVAGCLRHFTSLRKMRRDYGWINKLLEEAENERMHLLTWMQLVQPTKFERLLVIAAQIAFIPFYTFLYALTPATAHRFVGYLEEEATLQYTNFLNAIDSGKIENVNAPEIAIKYWNLPPDAKLRDVVIMVRADEMLHRDFNHSCSDKIRLGKN